MADGTECKVPMQRHADLYVFAWHPGKDWNSAEHRRADQWEFFVVAEPNLPKPPEPNARQIGIVGLSHAERGGYDALGTMVAKVLDSVGRLKARDCQETSAGDA